MLPHKATPFVPVLLPHYWGPGASYSMRKSKQFWQGFVRGAFWLTFKVLRHVPWKPALAWGNGDGKPWATPCRAASGRLRTEICGWLTAAR